MVFITPALVLNAQDVFFKTYKTISDIFERQNLVTSTSVLNDTAKMKSLRAETGKFIHDSILTHTKKILFTTFPDITFSDTNGKSWAISDFDKTAVILNYNYLYCRSCIERIDAIENGIKDKKVLLIVLFLDVYEKDISDLKQYGENVLIGFINNDTADLISLKQGDNCVYYLNKNRQIEYFDRVIELDEELSWKLFIKEYKE